MKQYFKTAYEFLIKILSCLEQYSHLRGKAPGVGGEYKPHGNQEA